ncbi:MAG: LPS export ABC transporter permease LptF [Micavibrio aeruginosavorus]|uniref:LPS export ABC transporter permease LptF n=1 Tax=Micavibrio aeruginosavorus TaxID=349221 RepID=A0A2W5FL32_9BACT|nr:MAG: LPS export ABC transporter permease LptF [Micavibrio aeruginosavorus]
MPIVDRYVFRNLFIATIFVTLVLSALVLLTQSLRFLELIINSGASAWSFWGLTMLALPRFFEIIIPIGLMASVLFVYNKFTLESELVVLRALGFSPWRLARPALILSGLFALFMFFCVSWLSPVATATMQKQRVFLKTQMSTLLFREGIFNQAGKGLMVYIRERASNGELQGLIIYDGREETETPTTVIAKRGMLVATDEGQQVIVYDGARQDYDRREKILKRLNFDQYTIDLPDEEGPVRTRWAEPEERTLLQLMNPDLTDDYDRKARKEFLTEIYKRLATPLMVPCFTIIALCFLLLGSVDRRGQSRKILAATAIMIVLQVLFLAMYNLAKQSFIGVPLMFVVAIAPSIIGLMLLSSLWHLPSPASPENSSEKTPEVSE